MVKYNLSDLKSNVSCCHTIIVIATKIQGPSMCRGTWDGGAKRSKAPPAFQVITACSYDDEDDGDGDEEDEYDVSIG